MGWRRIVVLLRLRELLFKDFPELVEVRLPAAAGELNRVQEELAADVWVLVVMASHNTAASTAIWECNAIGSRQQSTNPWITYGGVQQGNAAESTPRITPALDLCGNHRRHHPPVSNPGGPRNPQHCKYIPCPRSAQCQAYQPRCRSRRFA